MARPKGSPIEQFWAKVRPCVGDGCWEWTASKYLSGYGQFKHGLAHRFSWELHYGPIDRAGLVVCHTCDNKTCVRPDHLFLGTQKDNLDDMRKKGRERFLRGVALPQSKLTDENVREIRELLSGGWSQQEIADRFSVRQTTISMIARGKRWRHV